MGLFSRLFGGSSTPRRDVASLLEPLLQPAVRLVPSAQESGSWFGGSPAAPPGFEWPRKDGAPLAFLVQLDLAEVGKAHAFDWLPRSGALLFFYDLVSVPWGFDPRDAGGWRVLWFAAGTPASAQEPPADLDASHRLPRRALAVRAIRRPPGLERPAVEALALDDAEADAADASIDALFDGGPHHQVGGFPDPIQDDSMELECQLVSHGISCGDSSGFEDPRAAELEPGARDWRLLLQLDSDDEPGQTWGDLGRLYFWVRAEEARQGRFDGTWTILQCT